MPYNTAGRKIIVKQIVLILAFFSPITIVSQQYNNNLVFRQTKLDYDSGIYDLTEYQKSQLDSIIIELPKESKIELKGYADNTGSTSSNLELSKNRNEKIREYLLNIGIEPAKVSIENYGEKYIDANETSEVIKQKNRRVIISILNLKATKLFKGFITSEDSITRIQGKITAYINGNKQEFQTDKEGNFEIMLPMDVQIQINYSSINHFSKLKKFKLSERSKTMNIQVALNKMDLHVKENSNLEFIKGKSILIDHSGPQLEAIYEMMLDNPTICFEIGGHVYASKRIQLNRSSEKFKLSIARSLEVYNYLVNRGINESRMFACGFGNSELKYPNAQTTEEASANRRVELKIVDCAKASKISNPEIQDLESFRIIEDFSMGRNYNVDKIKEDLFLEDEKIIEQIKGQANRLSETGQNPNNFTYLQLFSMYRNQKLRKGKSSR